MLLQLKPLRYLPVDKRGICTVLTQWSMWWSCAWILGIDDRCCWYQLHRSCRSSEEVSTAFMTYKASTTFTASTTPITVPTIMVASSPWISIIRIITTRWGRRITCLLRSSRQVRPICPWLPVELKVSVPLASRPLPWSRSSRSALHPSHRPNWLKSEYVLKWHSLRWCQVRLHPLHRGPRITFDGTLSWSLPRIRYASLCLPRSELDLDPLILRLCISNYSHRCTSFATK